MKKLVQIIFACCLILCVSCEKEERSPLEQIQAGAPVVTDQAASVTEISVVLYGYVNPQYLMMGGECGFIISTSPSPSLNNGKKFSSNEIDLNGRYSVALEGLSSSTKYYFKAYVTSGTAYLEGEAKGFTTKSVRARVTTMPASGVSLVSATLNGNLSVEGGEELPKSVSFLYSSSEKTLEGLKANGESKIASLDENGSFSRTIESLSLNTTYYYVACAEVYDKEFYGEVKSFTTTNIGVTVTTNTATEIGLFEATLNGNLVVKNDEQLSKTVWFLYSDSAKTLEDLKSSGKRVSSYLSEDGSFTKALSSLDDNTTYYYVACAKVHDSEYYGVVKSFTTTNIGVTVTTNAATDIGLSEATLNGNLVVKNGEQLSKTVWFLYSDSAKTVDGLKTSGRKVSSSLNSDGTFTKALSSLDDNTTYYYVACAKVHDTDYYGDIRTFTTKEFVFAAVDLGLSVKWAERNLGATKPEEYGGYYQWAGTVDVSDTSIYLDFDNCTYHTGSDGNSGWTKYCTQSSYGPVDNKTTLEASDDAATVNLGGKWRMPTNAEWAELIDNCTWTRTTLNGIEGCLATSKKNGNSIFLPAAGYRDSGYLDAVGSNGFYWSSSLDTDYPSYAYFVLFYSGDVGRYDYDRCYGLSVRPVSEY